MKTSAKRSSMRVCDRCGARPATVQWGDVMSRLHGGGAVWCERCVAREQLRHAVRRMFAIPSLVVRSIR